MTGADFMGICLNFSNDSLSQSCSCLSLMSKGIKGAAALSKCCLCNIDPVACYLHIS